MTPHPLLRVEHLKVWFPRTRTFFGRPLTWIKAVDDVCFELRAGETLALVGESGSGKSTASLAVLRALRPTGGRIAFSPDGTTVHDLAQLDRRQLRPLRRHLQMVFQDPFSSLNPRMNVHQLIAEPLKVNAILTPAERRDRVVALLREVGLSEQFLNRYPHAFSGGQRQRLAIARALALKPRLIVCDEAVSALDVSVQAQILNLLLELKEQHGLAYLFVAHNLEVVRHLADSVAVMYAGRIVERGPCREVFDAPLHPYTQALLAAAPKADPARAADPAQRAARPALSGEVPDPANLPSGCVFHPRCPLAQPRCRSTVPAESRHGARQVRCLLREDGATGAG